MFNFGSCEKEVMLETAVEEEYNPMKSIERYNRSKPLSFDELKKEITKALSGELI